MFYATSLESERFRSGSSADLQTDTMVKYGALIHVRLVNRVLLTASCYRQLRHTPITDSHIDLCLPINKFCDLSWGLVRTTFLSQSWKKCWKHKFTLTFCITTSTTHFGFPHVSHTHTHTSKNRCNMNHSVVCTVQPSEEQTIHQQQL